jgi:hypothetical protein
MKMKIIKWGQPKQEMDLAGMESLLEKSFIPVEPRPEFKRKLHNQLIKQFQPVQEEVKVIRQRRVWMVFASLVGGVLTIFMGVRFVMTLIATIGLIMQFKKDSEHRPLVVFRQIR